MTETDSNADENEAFLDEELVPALVLVGVVLFLVPEPVTSALGIALVGVGVALWVWDLVR
ncbi:MULTISPECIES: hypothetical protein [Halorussus]|uniref:hypothetical protein n=1 Tax=Halorussus TaxID=1070314 RepID=UPI00209D7819|nr:hypothetical protein [Halorussus vallis]USZ74732.1 hypothetical protein NGM07_14965 [Halorussus vallis]